VPFPQCWLKRLGGKRTRKTHGPPHLARQSATGDPAARRREGTTHERLQRRSHDPEGGPSPPDRLGHVRGRLHHLLPMKKKMENRALHAHSPVADELLLCLAGQDAWVPTEGQRRREQTAVDDSENGAVSSKVSHERTHKLLHTNLIPITRCLPCASLRRMLGNVNADSTPQSTFPSTAHTKYHTVPW